MSEKVMIARLEDSISVMKNFVLCHFVSYRALSLGPKKDRNEYEIVKYSQGSKFQIG